MANDSIDSILRDTTPSPEAIGTKGPEGASFASVLGLPPAPQADAPASSALPADGTPQAPTDLRVAMHDRISQRSLSTALPRIWLQC